jgi:hypothetical protein
MRASVANATALSSSPAGLTRWSMLKCGTKADPKFCLSVFAAWIAGSRPAMMK